MYYADSDLLTVVIAMITIAAGIYSSVSKKKNNLSEEQKKSVLDNVFIAEEEIEEEADMFAFASNLHNEDEDMFDFASSLHTEEDEPEESNKPEHIEVSNMAEDVQPDGQQNEILDSIKLQAKINDEYNKALERMKKEAEARELAEQEALKKRPASLKERIARSPKDMILFAEILKPRYKEY